MGFIGSLLGGDKGFGYQAQGYNPQQAQTLYDQTQSGLGQQQSFLDAINATNPLQQQQSLTNQLTFQAGGGGPNPALDQLAQTTGQNVAGQAALMASQRGVGSNPGLLARQIAQQGAATQQQAGGQAALLRAQQQLAAQQILQNQLQNQVGQQSNAISNRNQFGLQGQQNVLGSLASQNSANSGIAGKAADFQGGAINNVAGAIGKGLQLLAHGGMVSPNCFSEGGSVPGAPKAYDSLANDKVPAMLSPGELVIPVSKTLDPKKTADFVNSFLGMNLKSSKKGK